MAARTRRILHDDRTREKIQASQLVNRLQANALGKLKIEMSKGQITSAIALLHKSLPDLSSVTLTGDPNYPVTVSWAHTQQQGTPDPSKKS